MFIVGKISVINKSRYCGDKVAQLVQFPAGALQSVLRQDSLFHIASVHPAEKWVPSIDKAVLRACARGIEMVSVCTVPAREGRLCEHFGGYKTIN